MSTTISIRDLPDLESLSRIEDDELAGATARMFAHADALMSSGMYDVCVLAARRLSCLYLALVRDGMEEISGTVISDKALDYVSDSSFLQGKRVLVVDDTVWLGSTLAHLKRRLVHDFGADTVRTIAVCHDVESIAPNLKRYIELDSMVAVSSQRMSKFSVDVARVLFASQVPYFSDFPVFRPTQVDASSFSRLVESGNFFVADVTSAILATREASSYTFVLHGSSLDEFSHRLSALHPNLQSTVVLPKIRSFVRARGLEVELTVVPIVLLQTMHNDVLTHLARAIAKKLGHFELIHASSEETHYRYLQYVCSLVLLDSVRDQFFLSPVKSIGSQLEPTMLALNFSAALAEEFFKIDHFQRPATHGSSLARSSIQDSIDIAETSLFGGDAEVARRLGYTRAAYEILPGPVVPSPGQVHFVGESLVLPLAGLFGYIAQELEIPEQVFVRGLTVDQFFEDFPTTSRRKLNHGLDFGHLAQCVAAGSEGRDEVAIWAASLALDVCNDAGIVVPSNQSDLAAEVTGRTYRVGENSFLGNKITLSRKGEWISSVPAIEKRLADVSFWLTPRFYQVARRLGAYEIETIDQRHLWEWSELLSVMQASRTPLKHAV